MCGSLLYLFVFSGILILLVSIFNFREIKAVSFSFSFFVILLYSIFLAVRPADFGTDTKSYMFAYNNATGLFGFEVNNNFEIGYNFLMSFFKQFGFDFSLFIFFSSFIFLLIVAVYVRWMRVNELFVITFVVLSSTLLSLYTNIYRQGLALSFVVAAAYYLYRSRFLAFLISGFLAFIFHVTSLAFLFILLSAKLIQNKNVYSSLFLLSALFVGLVFVYIYVDYVLYLFEFLGIDGKSYTRLESYISDDASSRVGVGVLLSGILVFLSLLMFRKMRGHEFVSLGGVDYELEFIRYIFYICINSLLFYIVFSGFGVISRIYTYSIVFEAILSFFVLSFLFNRGTAVSVLVVLLLFTAVAAKFLLPLYISIA